MSIIGVFTNDLISMTVLVSNEILHFILWVYYAHGVQVDQFSSLVVGEE